MTSRIAVRLTLVAILMSGSALLLSLVSDPSHAQGLALSVVQNPCRPLPLPSSITVPEFEKLLIPFLQNRCYQKWVADREIRDTGPFIYGVYYGTHPAVKVFYSPSAWDWIKNKNRKGEIPDGATIIKEQFDPPARPDAPMNGWSIFVRDKKGSWDGWYWSGHGLTDTFDLSKIDYKSVGYGTYCIRCHASAVAETSTFSTIRNVEDDPISYIVLEPAFVPPPPITQLMQPLDPSLHSVKAQAEASQTVRSPHDDIVAMAQAPSVNVQPAGVPSPVSFPNENFDHVFAGPKGPPQFITSDQCLPCHSANDINMSATFVNPVVNISPYTEWRASMMGLSGRDPIFHAQVESERAQFANAPTGNKDDFLDTKCFRCHGVMGQRQLVIDKGQPNQPMTPPFKHEYVYAQPGQPNYLYGALARDGVSCAVCHQMADKDPQLGTGPSFTGNFSVDKPGTMNGPFKDVQTIPMKHALGITPEYAPQIKSSALCGSCHTVIVPVFDKNGNQLKDKDGKPLEFHEQTTYMEWLNSDYQNEPELSRRPVKIADVQTCQDCHMPRTYKDFPILSRIANIEDNTYPFVDWRLPDKDITLKVRDDYSRHTLVGLNVFANQMFQQFNNILGIATNDYMYPLAANGSKPVAGLVTTQNSMLELAEDTATVNIISINRTPDALEVVVKVTNLAGHNFPSGVEFRRGFLEFLLLDAEGRSLWASGRTNDKGEIVEGVGNRVLPTEFFEIVCKDPSQPPKQCQELCKDKLDPARCVQLIQPHFFGTQYPITRQDQVQIYEELVKDNDGLITNSFVRLFEHVKDNRLLPKGWMPDGPYAEFSEPFDRARQDPGYIDPDFAKNRRGSEGSNTVVYRVPLRDLKGIPASAQATLYYQTIPPYYLKDRFSLLKKGLPDKQTQETKRLKYLADYLNVEGTPIDNWKLAVKCQRRGLTDTSSRPCNVR